MTSRHKHAAPRRAASGRPRTDRPRAAGRRSSRPTGSGSALGLDQAGAAVSTATARLAELTPWRRRAVKIAVPAIGVLAVVGASAAAVVSDPDAPAVTEAAAETSVAAAGDDIITRSLDETREVEVSRSAERPELPVEGTAVKATGTLLALEDGVTIHADANGGSPVIATVDRGQEVSVTGETKGDWTQVVVGDLPRWVASSKVAEELPFTLSDAPCPKLGESGLQPDTVKVLRAVCAEFPQVSEYGGIAGRGEHATGQALDIMVTGALGDQIAAFLQEHRAALGIEYLIWQQRIWRPATSGSWRPMSDRGGATANHWDHVHVTTYGNAATS